MSLETFCSILDANPNAKFVKFQGLGEPLMNPHLGRMIEYAKVKRGCITEVLSNGTLVPDIRILQNTDRYTLSIETLDPDKYKAVRKTDIDHIMRTSEYLRQHFKGTAILNCVLTAYTDAADAMSILSFARTMGFEATFPMQECWVGSDHPDWQLHRESVGMAINNHPGVVTEKSLNRERYCQWGYNMAFYDYLGRLHPCCIRMTDDYIIADEWNSKEMEVFRKERSNHPVCNKCPL